MANSEKILSWSTPDGRSWQLDFHQPIIMGIINITPDSFSDGGHFFKPEDALAQAKKHIAEGAAILDIGAETTRPGSEATSEQEEWNRLAPVLKGLNQPGLLPISVDTYKSGIAQKAIASGASIINDIYAGRKDPDIIKVARDNHVPIILMHMLGEPRTMQLEPKYDDVVREVHDFLLERATIAIDSGIPKEHIILDPGLGFGKTRQHNLTLLKHFNEVIPKGFLSLMALSRKAFLGHILNEATPDQRDLATAIANAIAVFKGANIIRVHAVAPSLEAFKVAMAIASA